MRRRIWIPGAAISMGAALLAVWTTTPFIRPFPGRDSAVFQTVASEMLNGAVPYLGAWDHKGPLLYVLNAIGLSLPLPGQWGIWAVASVVTLCMGVLLYSYLSGLLGSRLAAAGTCLWAFGVFRTVEGGNLTEQYGSALALVAFITAVSWLARRGRWVPALGGVAIGSAILLRPNLLGGAVVWALAIAAITIRRGEWRESASATFKWLAGIALPLAIAASLLAASGSLGVAYEAIWVFNAAYSQPDIAARFASVYAGVRLLLPVALTVFIAAGLLLLERREAQHVPLQNSDVICLAAAWLTAELVLASLSGQSYGHYYLTWAAPIAILATTLFSESRARIRLAAARRTTVVQLTAGTLIVLVVALFLWRGPGVFGRIQGTLSYMVLPQEAPVVRATASRVQALCEPHDRILVWGNECVIYLTAGRRPATSFPYQAPQVIRWSRQSAYVSLFLRQLQSNAPAVIVDSSSVSGSMYRPLSQAPQPCNASGSAPEDRLYDALAELLRTRYVLTPSAPNELPVYRRIQSP